MWKTPKSCHDNQSRWVPPPAQPTTHMKHQVCINSEIKKMLESCSGFRRIEDSESSRCSIRVSLKQLWFLSYRAKELTGLPFSCDGLHGHVGYPTSIPIGNWFDDSVHFAKVEYSSVNGPYWISYTEWFESVD